MRQPGAGVGVKMLLHLQSWMWACVSFLSLVGRGCDCLKMFTWRLVISGHGVSNVKESVAEVGV